MEVSSFRREFTALHRGFRIPSQGFPGEILGRGVEISTFLIGTVSQAVLVLLLWVKKYEILTGKGRTRARPWRGGLEGALGSVSFTFRCSFLRYSLVWLEYRFKSHVGNLILS